MELVAMCVQAHVVATLGLQTVVTHIFHHASKRSLAVIMLYESAECRDAMVSNCEDTELINNDFQYNLLCNRKPI